MTISASVQFALLTAAKMLAAPMHFSTLLVCALFQGAPLVMWASHNPAADEMRH